LDALTGRLLSQASGGLMPVVLAVATFQTIRQCFNLGWEINWQGINVADRASGVSGDITVLQDGRLLMAVEVTEREIDRNRVVSTFTAKIAPEAIRDYLFLFSEVEPTEGAREAARRYFPQGHDLNFMPVREWIHFVLATLGPDCREMFTANLLSLLGDSRVPSGLRMVWNEQVEATLNPASS
jgi:hypothetical protein